MVSLGSTGLSESSEDILYRVFDLEKSSLSLKVLCHFKYEADSIKDILVATSLSQSDINLKDH